MNTGRQFAAAFTLVAAFAGASANEAVVEEIVVVGQRAAVLEVAPPAVSEATLESFAPAIELPALEIGLVDLGADNG